MSVHLRSVRDPLLRTRDDPVLAIFRLRRGRLQAKDVATRVRLRHRQTDELLPAQDFRDDLRFELRRPKVEHRGQADNAPRLKTVSIPTSTAT